MKILIVARFKDKGYAPFVTEQVAALQKAGLECSFFPVIRNGIRGYLHHLPELRNRIREDRPDVVHAHFVFSGLLACLQRKIPVVTTYHGSDINEKRLLPLSKLVILLSAWNIFVSSQSYEVVHCKRKYSIIPCGVDLDDLQFTERDSARQRLGLKTDKKYVLFAGSFDRPVKNPSLAKETIAAYGSDQINLIEFKGYSREEATLLLCAVDALLLTSLNEGSPQVIKEALACGCPIVSVDVGDVRERIEGLEGCYIATQPDPFELRVLLEKALSFPGKTRGRDRLIQDGLDNNTIAGRIIRTYKAVSKI